MTDPRWRRECPSGKRQYQSRRAAKRAHAVARFRVFVYECDMCRSWHAANAEKRR